MKAKKIKVVSTRTRNCGAKMSSRPGVAIAASNK